MYQLMVVFVRFGDNGGATSQVVSYETKDEAENVAAQIERKGQYSPWSVLRMWPKEGL